MRITYDSRARAAYVYLRSEDTIWRTLRTTQRISDSVFVDLDVDANIVGIEILDVDAPVVERTEDESLVKNRQAAPADDSPVP